MYDLIAVNVDDNYYWTKFSCVFVLNQNPNTLTHMIDHMTDFCMGEGGIFQNSLNHQGGTLCPWNRSTTGKWRDEGRRWRNETTHRSCDQKGSQTPYTRRTGWGFKRHAGQGISLNVRPQTWEFFYCLVSLVSLFRAEGCLFQQEPDPVRGVVSTTRQHISACRLSSMTFTNQTSQTPLAFWISSTTCFKYI